MGILSLVRLLTKLVKPGDLLAFVISALIGYMISTYLPQGAWANYTFILVSYHLFLAWLVFDAEHDTGFSLPILSTIATHLACLVLIVAFGTARNSIPFFSYLRFGVVTLAFFERDWLFQAGSHKQKENPDTAKVIPAAEKAAVAKAIATATGDDHEAWMHYLAHRDPKSRKPGMSVKDEYEQWMLARAKSQGKVS